MAVQVAGRSQVQDRAQWLRRRRGAVEFLVVGLLAGAAWGVAGCGVNDEGALPPDVKDPATLKTPSGAVARYRGALKALPNAVGDAMFVGGVLTDELGALPLPLGVEGPLTKLDSRQAPAFDPARLHKLRAQARETRGFLAAFAPDSSPALRGHLYALEGYAEIYLADLFCSGIPLSTVEFDGDYTLAAGSTTGEVYDHAIALFDSALALSDDSIGFHYLAAMGRGRALLARGRYAEAAAAVAAVPDDYRYQTAIAFTFGTSAAIPDSAKLFWFATRTSSAQRTGAPSMGDQEGFTGLDYRTSGDPRTLPWNRSVSDPSSNRLYFPRKYLVNGSSSTSAIPTSPVSLTMASGVEARLIEAEAALQAQDTITWLAKLNQPRQTATATIVPSTGPLPDLVDPGTAEGRVDLLFRERAFWFYLTAQRQGDLRRLVRQYNRGQDVVYPTGSYLGGNGDYGTEVVVPVPASEQTLNPLYAGCFHRNA